MTTQNKDRDAFEKLAYSKGHTLDKYSDDEYHDRETEAAYQWYLLGKAACADRDKVVAELEAQLVATKRESGDESFISIHDITIPDYKGWANVVINPTGWCIGMVRPEVAEEIKRAFGVRYKP